MVVAKLDEKRKNIPFLIESLLPLFHKGLIQMFLFGALRDKKKHLLTSRKSLTLYKSITEHLRLLFKKI
jgi:hypothetical protein